jgi:CRP/FNR family transcriptional regulator
MREVIPSLNQIKKVLHMPAESGWGPLTSLAPAQQYAPGIELFKQESAPRDVYLIEDGLVKLTYVEQNARDFLVGLRTSGWTVGAASVILDRTYAFSATTISACRLRRVSADAFLNLLNTNHEFVRYFHQVQSHELYDQVTQLARLKCLSARDKLEQLLSQLIPVLAPRADENKVRVKLPLKQREMAELIGVTPEHLSRVLREMQNEGLVCREKGWIKITDVRLLQRQSKITERYA